MKDGVFGSIFRPFHICSTYFSTYIKFSPSHPYYTHTLIESSCSSPLFDQTSSELIIVLILLTKRAHRQVRG